MKKNAYYFLHDSNAHNDPKILKVLERFGWEGYGMFWFLLENMRDDANVEIAYTDRNAFAFQMHTDVQKLQEFIDFCLEIGLFIPCGKPVDNPVDNLCISFTSKRLKDDIAYYQEKSDKARKSANIRWRGHK